MMLMGRRYTFLYGEQNEGDTEGIMQHNNVTSFFWLNNRTDKMLCGVCILMPASSVFLQKQKVGIALKGRL